MIVLPVGTVLIHLFAPDASIAYLSRVQAATILEPLVLWQRVASGALNLCVVAVVVKAMAHARVCLTSFGDGQFFNANVVKHVRGVATWGSWSVLLGVLLAPIVSILLTLRNPPGLRMVTVGIDGYQILLLSLAGLLWATSWVLAEATSIARENAEFV